MTPDQAGLLNGSIVMAFLALVLSVFSTVGCFYLAHRLGVLRKDFKEKP